MFKELAPVLRHRAVLMTITSTEDDQIRVNVVPKKLKEDENKALTTPLTVTGTAEELDAEIGQTLVHFVGSHLQLKNTLTQAKADMEAAAKAAQAEARSKSNAVTKKDTTASATSKPAQTAKAAEPVQPPLPKTTSLFDMPAVAPAPAPASSAAPVESGTSEEDDIFSETNGEETEDNEALEATA
ncbi:MAG: PRTRC system protein E [Silvibacterium sp.]